MGLLKLSTATILFLCYWIAVLNKSDFWGNVLSPIIVLIAFYIIYQTYSKIKSKYNHYSGLFLSLSILVWGLTDILWAIDDFILHINPEDSIIITIGYSLTNLFLVISLSIYGLNEFRKWNIVQIFLDSIVTIFLACELIWLIFLDEKAENFIILQGDWISIGSLLCDFLIIMWILIWSISIRNGKFPIYLKLNALGAFIYAITDLIYYYQYIYTTYDPNTILDGVYVTSFAIFAVAGLIRNRKQTVEFVDIAYNIGRKNKGYLLLLAPVILIIFKGVMVSVLLHFVVVIFIYILLASYIQNNIHKERLLYKEQELNTELEQKVRIRTEELEVKNRELEYLVNQDMITGLANRRFLLHNLEHEINLIKDNETIVLLYIDINRYKMMVTMFGHYIGEKILAQMADRLKEMQKKYANSILASYGEDTFILAIKGMHDYPQAYGLAQEAIKTGSDIYRIEEYQVRVTANIGIAIYPYDAASKEELIRHADIAMSKARAQGFNVVRVFDLKISESFFRRSTIEIMLKRMNFSMELMLYYQPQLRVNNRELLGFEALIRWKTPNGDFISPGEFISIAEETGYIVPIGNWVIQNALKQIGMWNRNAKEKLKIGVNVSIKQLNTIQFIDHLYDAIVENDLDPSWVDLEIVESIEFQSSSEYISILEEIRKLGVTVSVDDFGTGYSSLSYLKNLPVDRIKIAKELVDFVHKDDFDYQLVKSIILLAKAKKIKVIAEGVETEEQWEVLKELQCDEIQGYLFGKPMPVDEVQILYPQLKQIKQYQKLVK